jgi:hypothetical protein
MISSQLLAVFARVHQTLRVTPAMESGLADRVMTIEEICNLLPAKKAVYSICQQEREMLRKALELQPKNA